MKGGTPGPAPVKRGPGRPRKVVALSTNGASSVGASASGLVGEIERIVEAKVAELLKARLGAIFE